jgi:hypothetical protein
MGRMRKFIPFGPFRPDTPDYGTNDMKVVKNTMPLFGGYRSLRRTRDMAKQFATEQGKSRITGAHSHLSDATVKQYARPINTIETPVWEFDDRTQDYWTSYPAKGETDQEEFAFLLNRGKSHGDDQGIYHKSLAPDETVEDLFTWRLSSVAEPASLAAGAVLAHIRGRSDSHDLIFTVGYLTGSVYTPVTGDIEVDSNDWETVTYELTAGENALLATHFDNLAIRFRATDTQIIAADAVESILQSDDETGGWEDEDGGTEDLYLKLETAGFIPDPTANDTYVISPPVGLGSPQDISFLAYDEDTDALAPTWTHDDLRTRVTAKCTNAGSGMILKAEWVQDRGQSTEKVLTSYTLQEGLTETFTAYSGNAEDQEYFDVESLRNVSLRLVAEIPEGGVVTGTQTGRVTSKTDEPSGNWSAVGGSFVDVLKDGSDSTYVNSPTSNDGEAVILHFGDVEAPGGGGDVKMTIRARMDGAGVVDKDRYQMQYKHKDGTWQGATKRAIKNGNWKNYTENFGDVTNNIDWEDVQFRLHKIAKGTDGDKRVWGLEVSELSITVPEPGAQCLISVVERSTSVTYGGEIGFVELELVEDVGSGLGDAARIYCGDDASLFRINQDPDYKFEDLTDPVAYANGYGYDAVAGVTAKPPAWDFCSWGNWIIGTNYWDPIQLKETTDTYFKDLITTTDYISGSGNAEPQGRHIAVVSSFLVTADCNAEHWDDAKPWSVCWSGFGDPKTFNVADETNQSTFSQLVASPGQITGLVGGEYGLIFKRNSIYRMTFTGPPRIFSFDKLTDRLGCSYTKSIVQVGQDVFFWDAAGIYAVVGGGQGGIQKISQGVLDRWLFDAEFEPESAMYAGPFDSELEMQWSVHGSYDMHSGLIWWFYRKSGDASGENSGVLIYNVNEQRFTHNEGTSLDYFSASCGDMLHNQSQTSFARGINAFRCDTFWHDWVKYTDQKTYAAVLTTKTITAAEISGNAQSRGLYIDAVRPIFRGLPDDYMWNGITVDVKVGEEPFMNILTDEATGKKAQQNRDGWISLGRPLHGEFWEFTFNVPASGGTYPVANPAGAGPHDDNVERSIKDILGFQVQFTEAGEL